MKIGKAIVISSLVIPVLVFCVIFIFGLFYVGTELINDPSKINGIFNAALAHAYIATYLSTLPVLILGYPISLYADKRGYLNKKVILIGSTILGGVVVSFIFSGFAVTTNILYFLQVFALGALGGLFVGYVFFLILKPNKPT